MTCMEQRHGQGTRCIVQCGGPMGPVATGHSKVSPVVNSTVTAGKISFYPCLPHSYDIRNSSRKPLSQIPLRDKAQFLQR